MIFVCRFQVDSILLTVNSKALLSPLAKLNISPSNLHLGQSNFQRAVYSFLHMPTI